MKPFTVAVFALCIFGALAENSENTYYGSVREVFNLYNECSNSEGLTPCLKLKALNMIERVSRMEKINLLDGVVISGKLNAENVPSLEEEEKNLPRALDAKDQALTGMIVNRIARMIGSKTIEVSIPKLIESARGKGDDSKFGDLEGLFDKFDDGDKKGGHGGGGHGGGGGKMKGGKKKKGGLDMKDFLMMVMAHKLAMIPLLIGGLFVLALKALTQAKIALLIAGIIFAKKMLANRNNGGHVEHVHAAPSSGGWAGGAGGGWAGGAGGGWDGGWDKRSIEETHNLAYQAQKQ